MGACAAGLPLQDKPEALLAETLFGQMLNLPRSRKKAVAYCMLMVRCRHASSQTLLALGRLVGLLLCRC